MFRKIVIANDGSDGARKAFDAKSHEVFVRWIDLQVRIHVDSIRTRVSRFPGTRWKEECLQVA